MTGWQGNAYSYLLFLVTFVAALCVFYAWRRRTTPGSTALVVFMAAVGIWTFGYALELGSTVIETKVLWAKVQYFGIAAVPVAWLSFALFYSSMERWLTRRNLALLVAIPIVALVLVWTNELHGLIWSSLTLDKGWQFLVVEYGPGFWVFWIYSYILLLAGTGLVLSALSRPVRLYRRQSLVTLFAIAAPWIGNMVYVLDLGPWPDLDLTPFAFLLSGVAFLVLLFRYRFLDITPLARDVIIENMRDGVVTIDDRDYVMDLNLAARRILGVSDEIVGKKLTGVLADHISSPKDPGHDEYFGEIELGPRSRFYELRVSPLNTTRGDYKGRLLTLSDVTERRRAEKKVQELNEDLEHRVRERSKQLEAAVTELQDSEGKALRNEKRFRSLVQNASDIVTVLSAEGVITYESPSVERLLGYRPEELVGKKVFEYLHPDDSERVIGFFAERLESNELNPEPIEFRFRHAGGAWTSLEAMGVNMVDDPDVEGILVNSRDVTKRWQMEASLRESLDMLRAVYKTGQILNSTLDNEEIETRVLQIMQRVSNLTSAVIARKDETGELRISRSVDLEGLWSKARFSEEAATARWAAFESQESRSFQLRQPDSEKILDGLCLPLRTRGQTTGVLEFYGTEDLSRPETLGILSSLAVQIAGALENARLYKELAERERRLQDLVGKLISAQEEERRRVAYDVHDGMTQVAIAAYQHLQAFTASHPPGTIVEEGALNRTLELVHKTVAEARRVIADLRPTVLDDFGLAIALRSKIEELRDEGWEIEYDENLGDERLPAEAETALYRVAQEALANVGKHAQTTRATVVLEKQGDHIRLGVQDQGRGFDPEAGIEDAGPGERVGFSSMKERMYLLGGNLEVESRPDLGTSVIAEVRMKGLPYSLENSTTHVSADRKG